jgi:hypothetical protein
MHPECRRDLNRTVAFAHSPRQRSILNYAGEQEETGWPSVLTDTMGCVETLGGVVQSF